MATRINLTLDQSKIKVIHKVINTALAKRHQVPILGEWIYFPTEKRLTIINPISQETFTINKVKWLSNIRKNGIYGYTSGLITDEQYYSMYGNYPKSGKYISGLIGSDI